MHPESLFIELYLDPSPNLPNFPNPNQVLYTLISPGYLHINPHLRYIAPLFIPQASKFYKGVTRWIQSLMNISLSSKPTMKPTSKRMIRKTWRLMRKKINTDEKLTQLTENLQVLTTLMMNQTNISKSSPTQKDTSTLPGPTTVFLANRRDTLS